MDEVTDAVSRVLDWRSTRARTPAAASTLLPLERHVITRNWESLSQTYELPLVTVVIVAHASPATGLVPAARDRDVGANTAARDVHTGDALHQTLASVARQSYPRIEVIVAEPCGNGTADAASALRRAAGALPVETVRVPRMITEDTVWQDVIHMARGALVVSVDAGVIWGHDKIADDVARLLRNPEDGAEHEGWVWTESQPRLGRDEAPRRT